MSILLGILASSKQSGGGTNPDATAFFNRVTAAGGSLTITEQNAINTLVNSLQASNLWIKLKAIYPMVGASSASCSINLKSSSYTGTFVGGWTFSSNGAKPNGIDAYMQTNFIIPIDLANVYNVHGSMYSRTQDITNNGCQMGVQASNGAPIFGLYQYYFGTSEKVGIIYEYPTNNTTINFPNTLGYQIISRTSTTSNKLYFNNTLLNTNTIASTQQVGNSPVGIGAQYRPFGTQQYSTQENAFSTLGDGLSDAESSSLYTIVQTFQTTLSRQV